MQQITLDEACEHLAQFIEAALQGEEIVILKDNQPVVKLTPLEPVQKRYQPGITKGSDWVSDDFDEPLENFKYDSAHHYPLREMPITITADFDEPMPEFWEALGE